MIESNLFLSREVDFAELSFADEFPDFEIGDAPFFLGRHGRTRSMGLRKSAARASESRATTREGGVHSNWG